MQVASKTARRSTWAILWVSLVLSGCPSTQIVDILEPTIRIAVVSNNFLDVTLRYRPLCDALNRHLGRPVTPLAELSGRSIAVHLTGNPGCYQLLYMDPVSYFQVSKQRNIFPLAIKVNPLGKTEVQGLIVVPADSKSS